MNLWMIGAALFVGTAANGTAPQAKPQAKAAAKAVKKASKPATLAVCPTMLHPVPRDPKNSLKYANTTVYFCCPACRAKFKGMAPAAQKARFQAAKKIAAKQSA